MKFKEGDIIVIVRQHRCFRYRYKGTLGKVIDVRTYHGSSPTHYLVKFICYKIPHIYFINDIDYSCELYKIKYNERNRV